MSRIQPPRAVKKPASGHRSEQADDPAQKIEHKRPFEEVNREVHLAVATLGEAEASRDTHVTDSRPPQMRCPFDPNECIMCWDKSEWRTPCCKRPVCKKHAGEKHDSCISCGIKPARYDKLVHTGFL